MIISTQPTEQLQTIDSKSASYIFAPKAGQFLFNCKCAKILKNELDLNELFDYYSWKISNTCVKITNTPCTRRKSLPLAGTYAMDDVIYRANEQRKYLVADGATVWYKAQREFQQGNFQSRQQAVLERIKRHCQGPTVRAAEFRRVSPQFLYLLQQHAEMRAEKYKPVPLVSNLWNFVYYPIKGRCKPSPVSDKPTCNCQMRAKKSKSSASEVKKKASCCTCAILKQKNSKSTKSTPNVLRFVTESELNQCCTALEMERMSQRTYGTQTNDSGLQLCCESLVSDLLGKNNTKKESAKQKEDGTCETSKTSSSRFSSFKKLKLERSKRQKSGGEDLTAIPTKICVKTSIKPILRRPESVSVPAKTLTYSKPSQTNNDSVKRQPRAKTRNLCADRSPTPHPSIKLKPEERKSSTCLLVREIWRRPHYRHDPSEERFSNLNTQRRKNGQNGPTRLFAGYDGKRICLPKSVSRKTIISIHDLDRVKLIKKTANDLGVAGRSDASVNDSKKVKLINKTANDLGVAGYSASSGGRKTIVRSNDSKKVKLINKTANDLGVAGYSASSGGRKTIVSANDSKKVKLIKRTANDLGVAGQSEVNVKLKPKPIEYYPSKSSPVKREALFKLIKNIQCDRNLNPNYKLNHLYNIHRYPTVRQSFPRERTLLFRNDRFQERSSSSVPIDSEQSESREPYDEPIDYEQNESREPYDQPIDSEQSESSEPYDGDRDASGNEDEDADMDTTSEADDDDADSRDTENCALYKCAGKLINECYWALQNFGERFGCAREDFCLCKSCDRNKTIQKPKPNKRIPPSSPQMTISRGYIGDDSNNSVLTDDSNKFLEDRSGKKYYSTSDYYSSDHDDRYKKRNQHHKTRNRLKSLNLQKVESRSTNKYDHFPSDFQLHRSKKYHQKHWRSRGDKRHSEISVHSSERKSKYENSSSESNLRRQIKQENSKSAIQKCLDLQRVRNFDESKRSSSNKSSHLSDKYAKKSLYDLDREEFRKTKQNLKKDIRELVAEKSKREKRADNLNDNQKKQRKCIRGSSTKVIKMKSRPSNVNITKHPESAPLNARRTTDNGQNKLKTSESFKHKISQALQKHVVMVVDASKNASPPKITQKEKRTVLKNQHENNGEVKKAAVPKKINQNNAPRASWPKNFKGTEGQHKPDDAKKVKVPIRSRKYKLKDSGKSDVCSRN